MCGGGSARWRLAGASVPGVPGLRLPRLAQKERGSVQVLTAELKGVLQGRSAGGEVGRRCSAGRGERLLEWSSGLLIPLDSTPGGPVERIRGQVGRRVDDGEQLLKNQGTHRRRSGAIPAATGILVEGKSSRGFTATRRNRCGGWPGLRHSRVAQPRWSRTLCAAEQRGVAERGL